MAEIKKENIGNDISPLGETTAQPTDLSIDVTENRVWVRIDNIGVAYFKQDFVNIVKQSELYKSIENLRK